MVLLFSNCDTEDQEREGRGRKNLIVGVRGYKIIERYPVLIDFTSHHNEETHVYFMN